jgi:hypothetical protein
MGATVDPVTLNASFWTLVATGACNVTFETTRPAHWVVNNAATQPTVTRGNDAKRDVPTSLALLAGEYLFIKGAGIFAGTATVTVS